MRPTAPTSIAIRNAKIVTVSGPVIAKGTVVVRNGLIEAVGENVAVPADARGDRRRRDDGLSGLVDALSTWGMPVRARAVEADEVARRLRLLPAEPPARGSRGSSVDHQLDQGGR